MNSKLIKALNRVLAEKKPLKKGEWNGETLWTCFAFKDHIPDDLHCTHKFMGEQSPEAIEEICNILDSYFEAQPFGPFQVLFKEEDWFGQNKDVRVLKPSQEAGKEFLPDLRKQLDPFMKDWYDGWKPHVTTDMAEVNMPFTRYCLFQGDKILREYSGEAMPQILAAIRKVLSADKASQKFKGKTARDVPFEEYATKDSPFMTFANKFTQYNLNQYVWQAIKSKVPYQAMQKETSKAWRFHGKQSSTLHMSRSANLANLLEMLYTSHPDAPPEMQQEGLRLAKSYQVESDK